MPKCKLEYLDCTCPRCTPDSLPDDQNGGDANSPTQSDSEVYLLGAMKNKYDLSSGIPITSGAYTFMISE